MVPSLCSRFNPHLLYRGAVNQLRNMSMGPIETSITTKISNALKPTHLQVINESTMHNVPAGSETHFKVVVVSEEFESKMPIQRHRIVNQLLSYEIDNGVHALSIVTRTPKEWEKSDQKVEASPNCRGGFGK
uniref:BolA-like protein DDB_G0274169 n=1 Tax=Lygus hesperus TaxID=30085 RepID=A0A0A9VZ93_LYGHE